MQRPTRRCVGIRVCGQRIVADHSLPAKETKSLQRKKQWSENRQKTQSGFEMPPAGALVGLMFVSWLATKGDGPSTARSAQSGEDGRCDDNEAVHVHGLWVRKAGWSQPGARGAGHSRVLCEKSERTPCSRVLCVNRPSTAGLVQSRAASE